MNNLIVTSECVSFGHPDKIADQISDLILDYYIRCYGKPKVAVEILIARYTIVVAGEVSGDVDKEAISDLIKNWLVESNSVPYMSKNIDKVEIVFLLDKQSSEIANLVDLQDEKIGAGDQGIMYGYANNDTESFMPAPIFYARKILDKIFEDVRSSLITHNLGPDAKSQIAVVYKDGRPDYIKKILISIQHEENLNYKDIKAAVLPSILSAIPSDLINDQTEIMVNPAGSFVVGGPYADTGLTGRKIIVDTYGGHFVSHGGGAFSGKDPTKVDRSGAYMTRYIAKNIVAAGIAKEAKVQIAYTIGMTTPFSFSIDTNKSGMIDDAKLAEIISVILDLSPHGIINYLDLWRPIYHETAKNGHFGNENFSWEKLNLADRLKKIIFQENPIMQESECNNLFVINEN